MEKYKKVSIVLKVLISVTFIILLLLVFGVISPKDIRIIMECRVVFENNKNILTDFENKENSSPLNYAIDILKGKSDIKNYVEVGFCVDQLKAINKNNPINYLLIKLFYSE